MTPLTCAIWFEPAPQQGEFLKQVALAFGIQFEFKAEGDCEDCAGVIARDPSEDRIRRLQALAVPTLCWSGVPAKQRSQVEVTIRFHQERESAWPLHGSTLRGALLTDPEPLRASVGDSVFATANQVPVWEVMGSAPFRHHVVSIPLPALGGGESLCDWCHGELFLHAMPLLAFLDDLRRAAGWRSPRLSGCFMFDDPNLHSVRYGHVDYAQIAERAARLNYHVSFATVPLDGWYASRGAVELFRRNAERLSLLVHGNDHTFCELAGTYSDPERCRLVASALCRIEALERRTGLEVSRVMAAPHGACSEAVLRELGRQGFEAACISPWSLRIHNPGCGWVRSLGVSTAEWIEGLPVMPRFKMSADCQKEILLAVLLGQPIIPVGHHGDLREGLGILDGLASFANRFENVRWADVQTIARGNYWTRISGAQLQIRSYSSRFLVRIPEGARELAIEAGHTLEKPAAWRIRQLGEGTNQGGSPPGTVFAVQAGRSYEVLLERAELRAGTRSVGKKVGLWPLARRLAAEARDRFAPCQDLCLRSGKRGNKDRRD